MAGGFYTKRLAEAKVRPRADMGKAGDCRYTTHREARP